MARPAAEARRAAAAFNRDRVSRAEIAWAVPRGSRRARSQGEFLRALGADLLLAEEHSVFQRNVRDVGRVLCRRASWADRTSMCTRLRICQELGIGLTCWKKCRRWLEDHGYLGTVRKGRMARFRRVLAAVLDDDRNDAAVYVLATPIEMRQLVRKAGLSGREARPPTASRREACTTHTRATPRTSGNRPALRADSPATPAIRLAFAGHAVLDKLTDRAAAHFWRPFGAAAWTPRDLIHAVDHLPGGQQHRRDLTTVIYPAGWLRWRLSHWLDSEGQALPSRSQRWAAAAAADTARRARLRGQLAALAAAAVPPSPAYLRAREQLGRTTKRK